MAEDQPTRERSQQPQTSEDTQATTSTETPKVVQETKGTDNEVETSAPVAEGSSTAEAPVNQQQATTAPEAGQAATLEALPENPLQAEVSDVAGVICQSLTRGYPG